MNTPAHADEAIRGLRETGIRSVFAYGFPNTSLQDWWFGPDYTGSILTSDGAEARRIRAQYFNSNDGLITMSLATRGPGFCKPDVVKHDWDLAKELDIRITVHVAMDRFGYTKLPGQGTPRHEPALAGHDLRPWVALHGRGVGPGPGVRRQRLVRPADRDPDGPRLGAGGHGDGLRHPDRAVLRRGHHGLVGPVHPDARDLRLGAGTQAPGGLGGRPRRAPGVARADHRTTGARAGRPSAEPMSRGSPTGRARSPRARRRTS